MDVVEINKVLTQFDVEDTGGRDDLERVGGDALVVARVGCVQVLNAQLGSGLGPADGDPSLFLDHRGVVLQPADGGPWVARHPAVQRGRLTLPMGDVAEWLLELQEVTCAKAGPKTVCQGWGWVGRVKARMAVTIKVDDLFCFSEKKHYSP